MDDPHFYFWIGLALGAVMGAAVALLYGKLRGLLGGREIGRLRQENRALKERLEKKDRHIQEMLQHTEEIAAGLAELANRRNGHGS